MVTTRNNPDLDSAFLKDIGAVERAGSIRRPRRSTLSRDGARQWAFRVLALISSLDERQRKLVLAACQRLNHLRVV